MTFYVGKSEPAFDKVLDPEPLVRAYPEIYGPRLDAIKELRQADDGSLHRGQGFRRVASFINVPLFQAATTLLNPDFMKDKKQFYSYLRRNRGQCVYDIRSHTIAPAGTETFVDGKPI